MTHSILPKLRETHHINEEPIEDCVFLLGWRKIRGRVEPRPRRVWPNIPKPIT